jgi:putative MFS transporter
MTAFEDAPYRPFHLKVVVSGAGGQFADGFSLGIIGIALSLAKGSLDLSNWWLGALGAASLVGLFFGSLLAGRFSDRIGRRPLFRWTMLIFTVLAVAQFMVSSATELLIMRILLGVALGADYVACKSLITEFSPTRLRGRLLSILAVAWAGGYVCAYIIGYLVRDMGPDAWRWALLSSAVPSLIAFILRFRIPESPLWLTAEGRLEEARAIIVRYIGPNLALPLIVTRPDLAAIQPRALFQLPLRHNLIVGCLFHTSQVIPFFALGTFLPVVMSKLGVGDGYTGALVFNVLLLVGAIFGLIIVDKISRRSFLVVSFVVLAVLLAIISTWQAAPSIVIVPLFAAFAFVLAAATNLEFVYPPELFPTELRATGIGIIIACSRIGSATSTFLLPAMVERFGIYSALGCCMVIMIVAAIVCQLWAPETRARAIV